MRQKIFSTTILLSIFIYLQGCSTTATLATTGGGAALTSTDQRSVGSIIDDNWSIEHAAGYVINEDPELADKTHINITSYNGIVLITGEAPTKKLKADVEKVIKSMPKVRRIHNMVTVAAPSSFLTRASDTTLTARIKASMLGEENFPSSRIKVVTENGSTYLMGLVTRAEGATAVTITQGISGVQKIVKLFEYTD